MCRWVVLVFWLGLLSDPALAGEGGDAALSAGDYRAAVRAYGGAIDRGEGSASVHFNLGLAHAHLSHCCHGVDATQKALHES